MAGSERTFRDIKELGEAVEKAVTALIKRKIWVGIPGDAEQKAYGGPPAPHLSVIAYLNEFGDDELHIPPRPFLVPGIQSVRGDIIKGMQRAAGAALAGDLPKADAWLDGVAEIAKGGVKGIIYGGQLTPLSPNTIYNRQHRKGPPKTPPPTTRTMPLYDQGDLFRNIQAVVKRGR